MAKDDVKSAMTKCGIKVRAADNIQMLLQRIVTELPSINVDAQASEDEDQGVEAEKTEDGQEVLPVWEGIVSTAVRTIEGGINVHIFMHSYG